MPWLDLVKAWLPEGVLLGVAAFFSHRIRDSARFPGDSLSFGAFLAFLIYMALWLVIWGLAVFAPGLMLFLSDTLKPAKDVYLIGGLPGVIGAGGMAFTYGGFFLAASFATMMLAAVIAGFALPAMMGISFHGLSGLQEKRPILDFGRCLLIVVMTGTVYWAWRGFCLFVIGDAKYSILADAAGTILLVGICGYSLDRQRLRQRDMKA